MKILITGSQGFIGKNLVTQLKNQGYTDLLLYDVQMGEEDLHAHLDICDFIFHLAGVNRTTSPDDFEQTNVTLTETILRKLQDCANPCPIVASSSIQAEIDNLYGQSKKAMENLLFDYATSQDVNAYIYRLPNVYGKWCRPNYNSVVATFCHNIARDLELRIDNPDTVLQLVYIDDVVRSFIDTLEGRPIRDGNGFCQVPVVDRITLGQLIEKLRLFHKTRLSLELLPFESGFDRKLYATFSSYLPEKQFSYSLQPKSDPRGYFCECLKCNPFGQISISVTKPGVTRGNHWHNTKVEKFLVLKGAAVVRFRKINCGEIIAYYVSETQPEIIDVPVGYTHSIENIGDTDMIALIWCSEVFDPEIPDTYFEAVEP